MSSSSWGHSRCLMGAGMMLTYRNVSRELALAKLKSDFVSNVSHELRTPLALIRLYAETLELGRISNPGKHQEYYEIIRKESERLTSLINNILDFSRIEAGKKEYSFRETDVADLVRSTLDSYRFEIEQNGFHFEQKIDNNLPPLQVDREAIARSLLNLVNNAVKYSATEKYLGVHLYHHYGNVNLEVVDHGIGIPAKEQPKIFEKFYRVGDPLVHNTKGSGLGLSLVRHIVHAHGGEVTVESAPGRGSKFIITLPVKASEPSNGGGVVGMRQEERAKTAEEQGRAKILVVEDEPNMVVGLRDNFEFEGYEVITARDGIEGLELALAESPDLVVLDVMMPRMSGLEVCKQLRAKRASIPIIMLTARGQEVDKVVGLELGADDYVTKPFSIRELLARVKAVLAPHRGRS